MSKKFSPKFFLGNQPIDKVKKVAEILGLKKNEQVDKLFSTFKTGRTIYKVASYAGGAILVYGLAKKIDKITGLLSLQIVAEGEGTQLTEKSSRKADTWAVSAENLHEYVGKPIFTSDRLYEKDPLPHGEVMGLAWTSMGGSALYIESQGIKRGLDPEGKPRGGGTLKVTGQLGDVMKESTQIAYTVARSRLADIAPDLVLPCATPLSLLLARCSRDGLERLEY